MGNAPSHRLFDAVKVKPTPGREGPARRYGDYQVSVDEAVGGNGVTIRELI